MNYSSGNSKIRNYTQSHFPSNNDQSNYKNQSLNTLSNDIINYNPSRDTFASITSNDNNLTKTIPSFLSRIESDTSEINVVNLNLNRLNQMQNEYKSPNGSQIRQDSQHDNSHQNNFTNSTLNRNLTNTPQFETRDTVA